MPENKDSTQDIEETNVKDSASTASSDYQENNEEKKETKKDSQKENKEQKNTRIIKKIIRGTKKEKNVSMKFEEGITFRGKLIGVEDVKDARGDKICQDSLQKLKAAVKSAGEHKQRIILNVSFQGIKVTNEKSNEVVYHHPVHMISFTSLDINDSRAFGYICGTAEEGHKFIGIKTEKAACQVVLTLQDLFQAVLEKKKQAMESAKKLKSKIEDKDEGDCQADIEEKVPEIKVLENKEKEQEKEGTAMENVINSTAAVETAATLQALVPTASVPVQSNVDDMLCLQLEVDQLQEGIAQMGDSMAAIGVPQEPFYDPFNTSAFVLYPKSKELYESTTSSTTSSVDEQQAALKSQPEATSQSSPETQETAFYVTYNGTDKYSAFTKIDTIPSIFENSQMSAVDDTNTSTFDAFSSADNEKSPPQKPIRSPPKDDLFADLDPLGKDRPFLDKKDFFYDLKNPPKKLLKDLVDWPQGNEGSTFYTSTQSSPETTEVSRTCHLSDMCAPFPCDFKNISPPQVPPRLAEALSSSLPSTSILQRANGDSTKKDALNPFNPFKNTVGVLLPPPPPLPPRLTSRSSEPSIKIPPLSIKCESTNIVSNSPNMPINVVASRRRGSFPVGQSQVDPPTCQENAFHNDSNSKALTTNSSHPIPIPARNLATNFQQNSFSSYNGQNLDNELNKTPNSFEAESPNITDYFGQNLNDAITNSTKFIDSTSRKSPTLKQYNRSSSCIIPEAQLTMNGTTTARTMSVGTISLTPEESLSIRANAVNGNSNEKNCLVNGDNTGSFSPLNSDKPTCSPTLPLYEKCQSEHVSQTVPIMKYGQKLNGVSSCEKSAKFCSSNGSVFSSGNIFSRKLDPFADDFFSSPKKFNDYQRVPNEL